MRELMLKHIEKLADSSGCADVRCSVLAALKPDDLFRVWAFIESFRPKGEPQKAPPNLSAWSK